MSGLLLHILPGTGRGTVRRTVEGAPRGRRPRRGPLHHPSGGPPPRSGEDLRPFLARLACCTKGTPATQFALVLPALTILLLGIIDVGRLMWMWNQAEKATQMGVRFAVVTNFVPEDLYDYDFALDGGIPGGDPVPSGSFSSTVCQSGSCTGGWGYNAAAFTNIVNRMRAIMPQITAANVTVTYENVGLGFAGDPNGADVAPLVTVRLRNLTFQPGIAALFGGSLTLPSFKAALTMEDGAGTNAN